MFNRGVGQDWFVPLMPASKGINNSNCSHKHFRPILQKVYPILLIMFYDPTHSHRMIEQFLPFQQEVWLIPAALREILTNHIHSHIKFIQSILFPLNIWSILAFLQKVWPVFPPSAKSLPNAANSCQTFEQSFPFWIGVIVMVQYEPACGTLEIVSSHLLALGNCTILARVVSLFRDSELILGMMGLRQKYTLDGIPVYCRAPCTHIP